MRLDRQREDFLKFFSKLAYYGLISYSLEPIIKFVDTPQCSSLKNYTQFQTRMGKVYTHFQTKTVKKTIPFGPAHTYMAYIRE